LVAHAFFDTGRAEHLWEQMSALAKPGTGTE